MNTFASEMVHLSNGMMPTLDALVGSTANSSLIDRMNEEERRSGGVVFGSDSDQYQDHYNYFMEKVFVRQNRANKTVSAVAEHLGCHDEHSRDTLRIIPISREEDLVYVPKDMQQAILNHLCIREEFENDEIFAFGKSKEDIIFADTTIGDKVYNFYQHIYENGLIEDLADDDQDEWVIEWYDLAQEHGLSDREERDIQNTFEFIDSFRKKYPNKDLTDWPDGDKGKLK
ncbi:MAG: hypothetical protein GY804_09255 [Alphaproteobacteria bacterium]|nr:hypothetical protein [Alphaproteobacteria bacterium]